MSLVVWLLCVLVALAAALVVITVMWLQDREDLQQARTSLTVCRRAGCHRHELASDR